MNTQSTRIMFTYTLLSGLVVSVEQLPSHAKNKINARPAWSKKIQVISTIPLAKVGKIYRPSLRCEAAKLKISDLVHKELGLHKVNIDIVDGGARSMPVAVSVG